MLLREKGRERKKKEREREREKEREELCFFYSPFNFHWYDGRGAFEDVYYVHRYCLCIV